MQKQILRSEEMEEKIYLGTFEFNKEEKSILINMEQTTMKLI